MRTFIAVVLAHRGKGSILTAALVAALAGCGRDVSRTTYGEGGRQGVPNALVTGPAYDFSYDEVGRLVAVATPSGDSAQYVYDPAGNILEIRRFAAGTLTIMGFFPASGGVGQVVTVTGAGFSTTPAQNTVQLNGLAASVLSSTSTQLTFAVPTGATTGPISVTVGASTATTGANVFTVTDPTIAITDFSPKLGRTGTVVAISGKGFDPAPINNRVFIGRALATVNAPATATSLQAVVSAGTSSGKVRVSSPSGTAISTADFFILPSTYAATDIGSTSWMQIGPTSTVNVSTAGKVALIAFDGSQGQGLSAYVTSVTLPGSTTIKLFGPDSNLLVSSSGITQGGSFKLDFGLLPATGTYTVAVEPSATSVGSLSLQLVADATGTLTIDSPAASMTLGTAQNGRYTFIADANDALGFAVTAISTTPAGGSINFSFLRPDAVVMSSVTTSAPGAWQLPALPFTGTYTLRAIPSSPATATFTVLLSRPLTGTLTLDGAATTFQTTRPGQTGRYTFSGTAGQGLTLQATAGATFPNGVQLSVYRPDGPQLTSTLLLYSNDDTKLDLAPLPVTGTYRVAVQPNSMDTGTVSLRLVSEATATLTVDGAASSLSLGTAQNGRYTFAGNANDLLGLGVTALGTTPAGGTVKFDVLRPDGTVLWGSSWLSGPTSAQLPALPLAGTYTLRAIPYQTKGATFTLLLSRPLTGALTLDGAATTFQTTRPGQTGRYTFSGSAGQGVTLQATAGATFPNGVQLFVYRPEGSQLTSTFLNSNDDVKLDLAPLPVTGTYTVALQLNSMDTGTVSLRLVSEATGTLTVDGAASSLSLGTAQNGRYTFAGNANDLIGLGVTALGTTPAGGTVRFDVVRPDGILLWGSNWLSAPTSSQLPALPLAGTYTLRAIPYQTKGATFTLLLSRPLTGTLTLDGAATTFQTTRPGQTGRYTFSGTAGQGLTLQATAGATFPNGAWLKIYRPDGSQLPDTFLNSNDDTKVDLAPLPVTGTYTVVVQPNGIDTGTVSLRLVSEATGTLTVDGAASSLSLGTAQNGRYTFAGNANDLIGLGVTALGTTPAGGTVRFDVVRPDGVSLWSINYASGPMSVQLPALPLAGTYTLRAIPSQTKGATFTLLLSRPLTGTLTVDGAATTFQTTRPGQAGRYTFSGTAGQGLTLQATAGASFPNGVQLFVYRPDGSQLIYTFLNSNDDFKLDLAPLPATGTYTVAVQPQGTNTGTVSLRLVSEATGTLAIGGPASSISLGTAQNGRYTFAGTTNDLLTLNVQALTTTPSGGSVAFTLLRPDGLTPHWSASASAVAAFAIPALPQTGTYTLRIVPPGTSGANLTVLLSR